MDLHSITLSETSQTDNDKCHVFFVHVFHFTHTFYYRIPLLPSLMSPPDGTFATNDEPTLTRHHHPESIVAIRITLGGARSMGTNVQ